MRRPGPDVDAAGPDGPVPGVPEGADGGGGGRAARGGRRHALRLGIAVAMALAVWLALASFQGARALRDAQAGKRILERAQTQERPSDLLGPRLRQELGSARSRLSRARSTLSGPLLAPVRVLPVVGRQVRSTAALAGAGARIAELARTAVDEADRIAHRPIRTGADRVAVVRELGEVAARVRAGLRGLTLGPDDGLAAPLARTRERVARDVSGLEHGLDRATAGTRGLADWLAGPRRYLVMAANSAEMRAGSGTWLSAGELRTAGGTLQLGPFRSVIDLPVPPGSVPLDGDLADRWGWLVPNQDWRNLMASPRFDASAALAARMWTAAGNPPVDGVLAVDPLLLQGLLQATGPVTVGDRSIDAANVVDELLHEQYVRFADREGRPDRVDALGRVAAAAFAAVEAGGWSASGLADGLTGPLRGRHLLAWSARPAEQSAWHAAGVDGTLRPDSLLVSVLNRGGNKLDQFLSVSARLSTRPEGDDTTCTLNLDLDNSTVEGEPRYVAGPHPDAGVGAGDYVGIVTVNLPGAARNSLIEGVDQLAVAGADGPTRVVGFQLVVPHQERRTLTVRFTLPGRHGRLRVEPTARQPGLTWAYGERNWDDGTSRTVDW